MTMYTFYIRYNGETKMHIWKSVSLPHLIYVHKQLERDNYIVYSDKKGTVELYRTE